MAVESATTTSSDRRQRFRLFLKRFNPSAPPEDAIGTDLIYDHPATSVFRRLAAGADLTPGSQQLVVGGIGSGKTTQLLLAQRDLSRHEGTVPLYIDVSAQTDLSTINSGALLASLGIRLSRLLANDAEIVAGLQPLLNEITREAYGYDEQVWEPDPDYDDSSDYEPDWSEYASGRYRTIRVKGKLKPPFPALKRDVSHLAQLVLQLYQVFRTGGRELVVFFDGLDRLIKVDQFWSVAEQDLRALRPLQISVLIAGPLSILYGQGRQVKDYFDSFYYLAPAIADPRESTFLFDVLQRRQAQELMSATQMQAVCLGSGGVLRDLVALARNSAESAYLDDADSIQDAHVQRAVEQLGYSYLLGLGTNHLDTLQGLVSGGGFNLADGLSMELLITRRVLERADSRYEVHPALVPLLSRTQAS